MARKRTDSAAEAAWLAQRDARNAEAKHSPVAPVKVELNKDAPVNALAKPVKVGNKLLGG